MNNRKLNPVKPQLPLAAALLLSTLNPQLATVLAQGSLTPPGAPAPTMKTLAQIEPRTPIASLPFTITNSGSYYVTANLFGVSGQSGITISNNDVTLDLGGFALIGVPGSLFGINVPAARTNLALRNGIVRGWSLGGVDAGAARNSQFLDLQVSQNGLNGLSGGSAALIVRCSAFANLAVGARAWAGSRMVDCTAGDNGSDGFSADEACSLRGCVARSNGGRGFVCGTATALTECAATRNAGAGIEVGWHSTISGCSAAYNLGNGITLGVSSTITASSAGHNRDRGIELGGHGQASACTAQGNTNSGIFCNAYAVITRCSASGNQGHGIESGWDTLVLENTCFGNGSGTNFGAGIFVAGDGNRIECNNLAGNDHGLLCTNSSGNFIIRNSARGNGTNYVITGVQTVGPTVTATGTITTNNPWANFSY
jgi:hypothetical protein